MKKGKKADQRPLSPKAAQMAHEKIFDLIKSQEFNSIEEVNEYMQKNVVGKRIDEIVPKKKGRKSAYEKSDDLIFEAYESDPDTGWVLAKRALDLNPENIRAMNFLAEYSDEVEESFELFKKGMETGMKLFGDSFFKENMGHFWMIHETRPFMVAKLGYAECLLVKGKAIEAINQYNELLALNPQDNQGVRYILSGVLLHHKLYEPYKNLYQQYRDDASTFWLFNYALFLFTTEGSTQKSKRALSEANSSNIHVLKMLLAKQKMVEDLDDYYAPGGEKEATYYLMENFRIWVETPGTLDWITEFVEKRK